MVTKKWEKSSQSRVYCFLSRLQKVFDSVVESNVSYGLYHNFLNSTGLKRTNFRHLKVWQNHLKLICKNMKSKLCPCYSQLYSNLDDPPN